MATYQCCQCNEDMTARVFQAFASQTVLYRDRLRATRPERPASVMVTCPNGHTCTYR
jgi:hypothetical protein